MQTTQFLAQLIGLFLIIVSMSMLVRKQALITVADAFIHDRPLLFTLGNIQLLGGLAIVLNHNVWSGGALPVIVTLIGWWLLLRAALLLFLSHDSLLKLYKRMNPQKSYTIFATIGLALGAYLSYAGLAR